MKQYRSPNQDYEKFLKFIKTQTKELKGISKPKEDKVKSILGVAGTGLGIFGIGSLFLGARRNDEFEKYYESKEANEDSKSDTKVVLFLVIVSVIAATYWVAIQ